MPTIELLLPAGGEGRTGLILRLRELAFGRMRYGYRRLTILLQREGWTVGKKRIYRLYRTENLLVRTD